LSIGVVIGIGTIVGAAGRMIQATMTTSGTTLEPAVSRAVREFARRVAGCYPVQQVILFGSRARGTQRTDSDADVAVLLRGVRGHFLDTKLEMIDIAYDVLLDTEIYIQPLPIWENEWAHPETHSNPRLLQNIEREGIPL
jgi:predicted nucleotidyltransferase